MDVSGSQTALIEEERRASYRFFSQVLRKKDMAFIISFGVDTEELQDFTNSLPLLQKGLDSLKSNAGVSGYSPTGTTVPSGNRGTVLYESVWLAAKEKLRSEVGRKALVVITDGNDFGSRIKIEKAIEEAQRSDAIIYVVLFEDPRYTSWAYGGMSGEGPMRDSIGRRDRRPRLPRGPQELPHRHLQPDPGRDADPVRLGLHPQPTPPRTAHSAARSCARRAKTTKCRSARATTAKSSRR